MSDPGERATARPTQRVAMLVQNQGVGDSRVMKEAATLTRAGYEVRIFCLRDPKYPSIHSLNGVTYVHCARANMKDYFRSRPPVKPRQAELGNVIAGAQLSDNARRTTTSATQPYDVRHAVPVHPLDAESSSLVLQPAPDLTHTAMFVTARVLGPNPRRLAVGTVRWAISAVRLAMRAVRSAMRAAICVIRMLMRRAKHLAGVALLPFVEHRLVQATFERQVLDFKPDIVHAHDLWTLPSGAILAERLGARLIYDSHELALHLSHPPGWLLQRLRASRQRRFIKKAAAVITVSDSIAGVLSREYDIRVPTIIYNAPMIAEQPSSSDVRSDAGLNSGDPIICYVGGIARYRGVEVVVEALTLLPEYHLVFVGTRSPKRDDPVRELGRKLGIERQLVFLPPQPSEQLASYLRTADVGVIPYQNVCLNHEYCMPNKLFECSLAGVPLAVSTLTDLGRFVESNSIGAVMDETDPASIAATIRQVVEAGPRFRPIEGRLTELRERYGWPAQERKLLQIYSRISLG